jgi:glycosyltransferase involved in cell wall biosynthesis
VSDHRVLVVHNRYRHHGGEERAVELQLAALERAGIPVRAMFRDSSEAGAARAATSILRGGEHPEEVAQAVRDHGATIAHFHNFNPLFGHRAMRAAREAGARVVLTLHNYRLFCAIAIGFRDGDDCFRCRGRNTAPGFRLNCRGSLPESAVYTTALALHQPSILGAVDAIITPSRYAADRLAELGLDRTPTVVANYVPDIAERSTADEGAYAFMAARLSVEKGIEYAIDAAAIANVPLKIAGDGPLQTELQQRAQGKHVEFLGRVQRERVTELLHGAALVLVPSISGDVMPFGALEAMAAGVPVAASDAGSLPEVLGEQRTVPKKNAHALADRIPNVYGSKTEGDALLQIARERFSEEAHVNRLLEVYDG